MAFRAHASWVERRRVGGDCRAHGPLGLGTDLDISICRPAAQTGITSMKATHRRVPMTGILPQGTPPLLSYQSQPAVASRMAKMGGVRPLDFSPK
jgi:hypothetical protein